MKATTGTVTITYSKEAFDQGDVNVYFYDDSRPVGERWVNKGGTQYTSNNSVVAEVEHFSTYGAFAEPKPELEPVVFDPGFELPQNEPGNQTGSDENNTTENNGPSEERPPEDDSPVDEGSEGENDESSEHGNEQRPQKVGGPSRPTGLFTGQSSSVFAGVFVLLMVLVGYLHYSGRIDVAGRVRDLRP
ncbi:MAG: hypothetical protein ABEJ87_06165 [Candidatus Nanohalobium sp.]